MAEKENEELRKEECNQTEKNATSENSAEKKDNLSEKDVLKQKQEELDDITDRYKRILAEFENLQKKKRKRKRKAIYT